MSNEKGSIPLPIKKAIMGWAVAMVLGVVVMKKGVFLRIGEHE